MFIEAKRIVPVIVLSSVFAVPTLSRAQGGPPPILADRASTTVSVGDLYLGIGAGAFMPGSPSFSGSGTLGGLPLTASGRLKLNTGPALSLFSSYEFVPHVSIEGQIAYSHTGVDRFEGSFTLPGVGSLNGAFPINGSVDAVAGFTNLVFTPVTGRPAFFPYAGAGIGFTSARANFKSVQVLGSSIPLGVKSSETDFALDAIAGVDYRITEHGNLGLVYQFSRTNAGGLGSTSSFKANTGALNANVLVAIFEYRF